MSFLHFVPVELLIVALTFSACIINSNQSDMPDDVSPSDQNVPAIQLDNMGSSAYVVLGIFAQDLDAVEPNLRSKTYMYDFNEGQLLMIW